MAPATKKQPDVDYRDLRVQQILMNYAHAELGIPELIPVSGNNNFATQAAYAAISKDKAPEIGDPVNQEDVLDAFITAYNKTHTVKINADTDPNSMLYAPNHDLQKALNEVVAQYNANPVAIKSFTPTPEELRYMNHYLKDTKQEDGFKHFDVSQWDGQDKRYIIRAYKAAVSHKDYWNMTGIVDEQMHKDLAVRISNRNVALKAAGKPTDSELEAMNRVLTAKTSDGVSNIYRLDEDEKTDLVKHYQAYAMGNGAQNHNVNGLMSEETRRHLAMEDAQYAVVYAQDHPKSGPGQGNMAAVVKPQPSHHPNAPIAALNPQQKHPHIQSHETAKAGDDIKALTKKFKEYGIVEKQEDGTVATLAGAKPRNIGVQTPSV